MRDNLNKNARPKAIEWHKSAEAKEWHKQHYEQMKDKMLVVKKHICKQCGKEYESKGPLSKFCCNNCKSQWRRDNHIDDVERICPVCGNKFIVNKYSKAVTCSRRCQSIYRKQNK